MSSEYDQAIDFLKKIEGVVEKEEGQNGYRKGGYHVVKIGDVYNERYTIEKKLGWGHFSTVWLASDNTIPEDDSNHLVAIKIQKSDEVYTEAAICEIEFYKNITEKGKENDKEDNKYIVCMIDSFYIHGVHGKHMCMVFEAMGQDLLAIIKQYKYKGIPIDIVKEIAKQALSALTFLHSKCDIIHTDVKPENFLLSLLSPFDVTQVKIDRERAIECYKIIKDLSKMNESTNVILNKNQKKKLKAKLKKKASEKKKDENITIDSREEGQQTKGQETKKEKQQYTVNNICCKISDLGAACYTTNQFSQNVTTRQYRAPEVILGLGYNNKIDIWSLACFLFELLTGDYLFDPRENKKKNKNINNNDYKSEEHLALIMELLGPIPNEMKLSGTNSKKFFDRDGELKHVTLHKEMPLDELLHVHYKMNSTDVREFCDFLLPMLEIESQKRISAGEALKSSFLVKE